MRFFCPVCWREVGGGYRICPGCGTDILWYSRSASYVEKLIAALHHREPQTVRRAAWVLGRLKAREAVSELLRLGEQTQDPYVLESVVEALGEIRDERARAFLARCAERGPLRARNAARWALMQWNEKEDIPSAQ